MLCILQNIKVPDDVEENSSDKDYKPHGIEAKMASGSYKRVPKMERKEIKQVHLQNTMRGDGKKVLNASEYHRR